MAHIDRPYVYPEGVVAQPKHANANEIILYNLVNGNIDWQNLKAALANTAHGLVKLDVDKKVPVAQIPSAAFTDPEYLVPAGGIIMWSGTLATIPAGWVLCDGTGGTPDLRDKFILGCAVGVDPGGTGGSHTRVLTEANLPSHTHGKGTLGADSAGNHQHSYNDYYTTDHGLLTALGSWGHHWAVGADHARTTGAAGAHPHTISGTTGAIGSGASFDNRPAYFALAFIMKT